ncbi:MAG: hypothetical protein RQ856_01310 [Candidatus Izemoplasmatales bacterium]|nr:hypothetical protein [Candidatus Izemoplasmatales bacterium]
MKKFFSNVLLLILVLLVSVVAVPWNRISQWGFELPLLTNYELIIKGIIGALVILMGILFLFISNKQYNETGSVENGVRNLAVIPLFAYSLATMAYTAYLAYSVYMNIYFTTTQLLFLLGSIGLILTLFLLSYFLIIEYKKVKNFGRLLRTLFLIELVIGTAGLSYFHLVYRVSSNYTNISTKYMIFAVPLFLLLYGLYLIFGLKKENKLETEESLEHEIKHGKKVSRNSEANNQSDNRKTMIVSKEQNIVSGNNNLDPTNIVFQDVEVDPEFSKLSNQNSQANSIEYYIEKPKMFKPLDPSFDELVSYVRELPQVVTKLDDDRITFYVDRKPFLVLMNFGNYYRMAFKYDLEQGIRLIIKYPTISKNKSTRDELWFKANNYGDIPKDVVYSIVKTAHNNYSN